MVMIPYAPWLVWLLPLTAAPLVAFMNFLHPKARDYFAVVVAFVTAALAVSMIPDVVAGPPYADLQSVWISIPGLFTVNVGVYVDPLSVFIANIAAGIGALIVLYSLGYMGQQEGITRYYFFMLLFIGGMVGLVMADNFFQLYIFWEIVGLCSYALIGFWYKRPEARKAGLKAFVVTRVGDACLLIGIILIYLNVGSLGFVDIENFLMSLKPILPIFAIIPIWLLGGAIGKSAQLPLHTWLPDAMEGPSTVSALIHAATMVKAGVYLMARTHLLYSSASPEMLAIWLSSLAWIGGITALSMALLGLVAVDMKKVLAYSTISQIGYMMLALGVTAEAFGVFASQFHLMSHAFFKALLFLCAGAVLHATGTRDMRQMGGLRHKMPITFVTSLIGVLALSAIPPFNGFWSKDIIFEAVFHAGNYPILILAVLTAVVTFAYCLRFISMIFLGKPSEYLKKVHVHEAPAVMTVPLIILAIFTCITGFLGPNFASFMAYSDLHFSFVPDPVPLTLTICALVAGGVPGYFVFFRKIPSAERVRSAVAPLHKILENGYYFDWFYYTVFWHGLVAASQKFRKTHPGILNINITGIMIGICLIVFLISILGGI
jgi:NADH-quinone oxidoreductase subunit L